jgi:hypoxanthine phosphoribosyltransferase
MHIDVLFSTDQIAARIDEMAREVAGFGLPDLLVVPVLKGSFIFAADLVRAMHGAGLEPHVDFMMLASYHTGTTSSGKVDVLRDIETDVRGRGVLLVDDIFESGRTLNFARSLLESRGATVRTAVLLEKPGHRVVSPGPDLVGFTCPDVFVVGYGMDAAHRYRELPFIGVVRED